MSIIFGILLTAFSYGQLPELKIEDPGILSAFQTYLDSLMNEDQADATYHLVARVDNMNNREFVYVQSVVSLSSFWGVVPDKYTQLDSRIVFWYERKHQMTEEENSLAFKEFVAQFGKDMINNMSPEGKEIHSDATKILWKMNFIEPYRFEIKESKVISVKKLCSRFPDPILLSNGVSYDINGYPVYEDGVYDHCALDGPFTFTLAQDKDFDVNNYIRKNAGLPIEKFLKGAFAYRVTIDEKGKVVNAVPIYPTKIDPATNRILVDVMLNMPNWNVGTIKGKPVSYRVAIGL